LKPDKRLWGRVVITVKDENETRHQRNGKQTSTNPDLGHRKRRKKGNKSSTRNIGTGGGGMPGEVKRSKKSFSDNNDEFLPRVVTQVASIELPTPYVRVKLQGQEIYAKGLVDTGNSCKYSLISEDFFNL